MAMTAYLNLEGKNQGKMEGDCAQKGHENWILVYGSDHSVEIPKDPHTGLPTGQRIHQPLIVTKHKDKSTPKLFQACTSGEQMKTWEMHFMRISEKGQEEHYFTIKLENAIIVQMRENTPLTFLEENKPYHDMEEVSFTYEKIVWTYEPDGVEAEDDWKAPKSG